MDGLDFFRLFVRSHTWEAWRWLWGLGLFRSGPARVAFGWIDHDEISDGGEIVIPR